MVVKVKKQRIPRKIKKAIKTAQRKDQAVGKKLEKYLN